MEQPFEPLQDRSRETLARILATAADAAAGGGFDDLSIREICRRSGVTTGAFYARFKKKDDLAFALFESLSEEFRALVDDHLVLRESQGLEGSVRILLSGATALYRRHAGLLHMLTTRAGLCRELAKSMRELNDDNFARLVAPPFPEEIRHPVPALGLRIGFLCVFTALKEIVLDQRLFDEAPAISDKLLVDELTAVFLGYVIDYER